MNIVSAMVKRLTFRPAMIVLFLFLFVQCTRESGEEFSEYKKTVVTEYGNFIMVYVGVDNPGSSQIAGCLVAECLISYDLWAAVRNWAEHPDRGDKAYSFAFPGMPYSAHISESASETFKYNPVVSISWWDALIWMNAFTEWYNENCNDDTTESIKTPRLTPVYFTDAGLTDPIRHVNTTSPSAPYVDPDASGFRLLSTSEWQGAIKIEITGFDEKGYPIRELIFPDMDGPVSEWCFDKDTFRDDVARSWRGGGQSLRKIPCQCAVSLPVQSMSPERTSMILGVRISKSSDF